MPLLHVLILAIVQGVTEFLPISSSGHLVITWEAFDRLGLEVPENSEADRLIIDIAAHLGTLLAVVVYFWRDMSRMGLGLAKLCIGRWDPSVRLVYYLIVASIPIFVVGFVFKDLITLSLRDHEVIAWATIGFGLLLYLSDRVGMTLQRIEHLGLGAALTIGLAQTLALIPGTSRSGITITAARFLGFERQEAARFSLLLAIPAILGAGALAGVDLYDHGSLQLRTDAALAAGLAFVAALVAIAVMMAWLRRATFTPFVAYRICLGLVLLWLIYQDSLPSWLTYG